MIATHWPPTCVLSDLYLVDLLAYTSHFFNNYAGLGSEFVTRADMEPRPVDRFMLWPAVSRGSMRSVGTGLSKYQISLMPVTFNNYATRV